MVALTVRDDQDSVRVETRLKQLADVRGKEFDREEVDIEIDDINIIPQARKTFVGISTLGESIARKGMYYKQMVVRLSTRQLAKAYIAEFNRVVPGSNHRFDLLKPASDGYYYVLIAGERRTRGCWHLHDVGCRTHRRPFERKGETMPKGFCLERHFPGRRIPVIVFTDITPREALDIQMTENSHEKVPEFEEAPVFTALYRLRSEEDPRYSRREFAKDVGRSERQLRRMFHYCNLPKTIWRKVEQGQLDYAKAVELARLVEEGVVGGAWLHLGKSDQVARRKSLRLWIKDVLSGDLSVRQVRRRVTQEVESHRMAKQDPTKLMDDSMQRAFERANTKEVLDKQMSAKVSTALNYLLLIAEAAQPTSSQDPDDQPIFEVGDLPFLVPGFPQKLVKLFKLAGLLRPLAEPELTKLQRELADTELPSAIDIFTQLGAFVGEDQYLVDNGVLEVDPAPALFAAAGD